MPKSSKKPIKKSWQILLDKLSENLERNERRFELIQALDREIQQSSDDPDKVFGIILEEGLKEVNADFGHIMIRSGSDLEIAYSNHKSVISNKIAISESLCGHAFDSMKFKFIADVKKEKVLKYYKIHNQTRTELAIPIRDFRGIKIFGILNIEWKKLTNPSTEDLKFCDLLVGQLAIAMEQIKLWQGVRMVSELSSELLESAKSREGVFALILNRILSILDFDLGQILLANNNKLVIAASSNPDDLNVVLDEENSICAYYIFCEEGITPLKINDIENSPYKDRYNWILGNDKGRKVQMKSEFVVPLIGNENNIIGVINIEDPRKEAFSEFDEFIIGIFGKMIATAIESSNNKETIKNIQSAKDFDLIFASLGHLSINFLHNFGGGVNNAKARLFELKRGLLKISEPLPSFGQYTGFEFIDGIVDDLRKIEFLLSKFRDKLQPENINKKSKQMDLIVGIKDAIQRAESKRRDNIEILFIPDDSIEKRRSLVSVLSEEFDEILDLLLKNGIEAIETSGKIEVHLKLTGLFTAQIAIKDNGIGMNKDTKERVFDFGFTTKTNIPGKIGEGIGLWLAKIYLHRFGAELDVESNLGEGSTFIINIPIILQDNLN